MPLELPHRIILASASPRRAELLRQIGVRFETRPVDLDESVHPNEAPAAYVRRLALEKAEAALAQCADEGDVLVIGSDTSVVANGTIFGKPATESACLDMLQALSGSTHEVLTGVALVGNSIEPRVELVATRVSFRTISRQEIAAYWHTGEPCDKAGGYAIQGRGAIFVRNIEGSYSAVMGLPIFETAEMLRQAGVDIWRTTEE